MIDEFRPHLWIVAQDFDSSLLHLRFLPRRGLVFLRRQLLTGRGLVFLDDLLGNLVIIGYGSCARAMPVGSSTDTKANREKRRIIAVSFLMRLPPPRSLLAHGLWPRPRPSQARGVPRRLGPRRPPVTPRPGRASVSWSMAGRYTTLSVQDHPPSVQIGGYGITEAFKDRSSYNGGRFYDPGARGDHLFDLGPCHGHLLSLSQRRPPGLKRIDNKITRLVGLPKVIWSWPRASSHHPTGDGRTFQLGEGWHSSENPVCFWNS